MNTEGEAFSPKNGAAFCGFFMPEFEFEILPEERQEMRLRQWDFLVPGEMDFYKNDKERTYKHDSALLDEIGDGCCLTKPAPTYG